MGMGFIRQLHVTRLKQFFGSKEDARTAALIDGDQFVIRQFLAYRGHPDHRSQMEFEIEFEDGTIVWKPYDRDSFDTQPCADFCRKHRHLYKLLYTEKEARRRVAEMNKRDIDIAEPGQIVYVPLRFWGDEWVQQSGLPDVDHIVYVLPCQYVKWATKRGVENRKFIVCKCDLWGEVFKEWDYFDVFQWGTYTVVQDYMQVVDEQFCLDHPTILHESHRDKLLAKFARQLP